METLVGYRSSERAYLDAVCAEAEKLGYGSADAVLSRYIDLRREFRSVLAGYRESTLNERLRGVLAGAPDADVERLVEIFREFYASKTTLMPGVVDMLRWWKEKARLAVVSNFFVAGMPEYLCERHAIRGYFDFVLDSAQVGWRKPHPNIFDSALQRAGIARADAPSVMFVGDDPACDVDGPRALGFRVALYASRRAGVASIERWADFR